MTHNFIVHFYQILFKDWQWQCGAVSIWLSWLVLLFFIQKVPVLGIYILMFVSVVTTFFRFSAVFLLFILGFTFSFYMLLQNQGSFDTFSKALIKTVVMMIGEYDYAVIFETDSTRCTDIGDGEEECPWLRGVSS